MRHAVRKSLVTIVTAGALTLLEGPVSAPAHAATGATQSPASTGICFTHWIDDNGNDLPFAEFTCLATSDAVWEGQAQCTDDAVYFTQRHTGSGNDRIDCPSGEVVIDARVTFLN